jgi:hypothetical protein
MCRIFLKYVVRESARVMDVMTLETAVEEPPKPVPIPIPDVQDSEFWRSLQDDFNNGRPFRLSEYEENLKMLGSMGFAREDAMEALCMCDNKSMEALEILLQLASNPSLRARKRADAAQKLGKQVGKPITIVDPRLTQQIAELRAQLQQDREQRAAYEREATDVLRRARYLEFLRGLIAHDMLTVKAVEALQGYSEENGVSQQQHLATLAELAITPQQFEELKRFDMKGQKFDMDCVVCLDKPRSHVIYPCGHLCLCDNCVVAVKKKGKCPICQKRSDGQPKKVFYG